MGVCALKPRPPFQSGPEITDVNTVVFVLCVAENDSNVHRGFTLASVVVSR